MPSYHVPVPHVDLEVNGHSDMVWDVVFTYVHNILHLEGGEGRGGEGGREGGKEEGGRGGEGRGGREDGNLCECYLYTHVAVKMAGS